MAIHQTIRSVPYYNVSNQAWEYSLMRVHCTRSLEPRVGAEEIVLETGVVCGGHDLLLRSLSPLDKDSRYLELLRGLRAGSPGCLVKGDLVALSLEIEPGARFEGQCRMPTGLDSGPVVFRDQNLLT